MDIFGVGALEVLVILFVAFLVLGPAKSLSIARDVGKFIGRLRNASSEFSRILEEEEEGVKGKRAPAAGQEPLEEPGEPFNVQEKDSTDAEKNP